MNTEKNIKNFYEEEKKYEESIIETKKIIENIISMDTEIFDKKIALVDSNNTYKEFIELLNAVIGKHTKQYYYCKDENDVKYYNLEIGKVYKVENLNRELQEKSSKENVLDLEARAILANNLLVLTNSLKELFKENVLKTDNSFVTLDSVVITQNDLDYLENIIKYIQLIIDKSGRLKILVAERDVYALEKAKKDYAKKTSIEKWFHKVLKNEDNIINNMANKNKDNN